VDEDALELLTPGELEEGEEVPFVGVDASVGKKTQQVQSAAAPAHSGAQGDEGGIPVEAPIPDREIDAKDVLRDHAARAEVQVPDLGIAHLSGGKPHVLAGGGESRRGEISKKPVVARGAGERDRISVLVRADAPSVADDEDDRTRDAAGRSVHRDGDENDSPFSRDFGIDFACDLMRTIMRRTG
jgi:hypothetical protein